MERAMSDRLRARLEEERAAIRQQLADLGADPDREGPVDLAFHGGFADSAQLTAERARLLSLIEGMRENLADIDRALAKLEAGSGFGVCERCGNDVGDERMEAIPWARLCIACKQEVG